MTARAPMLSRSSLLVIAVVGLTSAAEGQAPSTLRRTGAFDAVLTERSPESDPRRWSERFRFGGSLEDWDYDLADESFSLYVPPDYDPHGEPYGVVVWVSAFDTGAVPAELRPVFDRRHLIWIGPNDDGNRRHLFQRMGLALDAVVNVRRLYNIDSDRIFVSGLSGGGKVAAMLAIGWSDVFAGGFPVIGMTTYLNVPLESNPGHAVYRFAQPSPTLLERAKRQPLVILTGSGDFNREECRLTAAAYEREGFTDLHLLDIQDMGHEMPSAESFARGLDLLLASSTTSRGAARD